MYVHKDTQNTIVFHCLRAYRQISTVYRLICNTFQIGLRHFCVCVYFYFLSNGGIKSTEQNNRSNCDSLKIDSLRRLSSSSPSCSSYYVYNVQTSTTTLTFFVFLFHFQNEINRIQVTINDIKGASQNQAIAVWTLYSLLIPLSGGFLTLHRSQIFAVNYTHYTHTYLPSFCIEHSKSHFLLTKFHSIHRQTYEFKVFLHSNGIGFYSSFT